jgi:hypothetical protein
LLHFQGVRAFVKGPSADENLEMAIFFDIPIRPAPNVLDQPRVQTRQWRLLRYGDHHFLMCQRVGASTVRVTTPIQSMNPASMTVQTGSGRVYELLGPPSDDPAFLADVQLNLKLSGLQGVTDVSLQIYAEIKRVCERMNIAIDTVWRILWDTQKDQLIIFALISATEAQFSAAITRIDVADRALIDELGWRYSLRCAPNDDTDPDRVRQMDRAMEIIKDDAEDMTEAIWSLMA